MASSPPRWPKILLRTALVLAVLGGLGWGGMAVWKQVSPGLFGTKRNDVVPVSKVRNASIAEEIVAVGRLRAAFSTELRAEINGRITKILAVDGQTVARDQEIVKLDQQDLLTQAQESDRSIEAAKLRAQRSRRDYERLADLHQRGLITLKDFEDARITLSLSENDSAIAEARAANIRDRLSKTVIRAPHSGTLLLRDLTEGQVITGAAAQNGGTVLGEVADLSALMVRTNINEIDVARLKVGDQARVRVDSIRSAIIGGTIKRIATSALESTQDRTRVFPVDVYLDVPDDRLRPGMSATVTFTLAKADNVISVPLNAVFSTAESMRYVFVKNGAGFEVRPVEVGIADTRRVQVLTGLQAGDDVATARPLAFEGEIPAPSTPAVKNAPAPRRTGT